MFQAPPPTASHCPRLRVVLSVCVGSASILLISKAKESGAGEPRSRTGALIWGQRKEIEYLGEARFISS